MTKAGAELPADRMLEKRFWLPLQHLNRGFMYCGTLVHVTGTKGSVEVERIQTGVRMEKRLLKVLKAVAELKDMTLGDLLEGIVLHAFEGKSAFSPQTLKEIEQFRNIYGLTLRASDSHRLRERK